MQFFAAPIGQPFKFEIQISLTDRPERRDGCIGERTTMKLTHTDQTNRRMRILLEHVVELSEAGMITGVVDNQRAKQTENSISSIESIGRVDTYYACLFPHICQRCRNQRACIDILFITTPTLALCVEIWLIIGRYLFAVPMLCYRLAIDNRNRFVWFKAFFVAYLGPFRELYGESMAHLRRINYSNH